MTINTFQTYAIQGLIPLLEIRLFLNHKICFFLTVKSKSHLKH